MDIFHVCTDNTDGPNEAMEHVDTLGFTDGSHNEYYKCESCDVIIYLVIDKELKSQMAAAKAQAIHNRNQEVQEHLRREPE